MIRHGDLILAIDQGTHSTRAALFDARGRQQFIARQPVELQVLDGNRVEQSPNQILRSMQEVIGGVLHNTGIDTRQVRHAGLATQRSSVLAWRRDTGMALSPVLGWQDRRAAIALKSLEMHENRIRQATGLRLSPHYGAGKLQWLLANQPEAAMELERGNLVMGPLAAYLLQHLLPGSIPVVDAANASRTLLWNLRTRDWESELLDLFGIPREVLPGCRPILHAYGALAGGSIPLHAVNGDQTAALYAEGRPPVETIVVNIGTGAFVLLPVADPANCPGGLLAGISRSDPVTGDYYAEGTVNGALAALEWVAQRYRLQDWLGQLPGWFDGVTAPPIFLNSIGGLGAPWWRPGPEPEFLTEPDSPAQALAGAVESILFLIQANVALLQDMHPDVGAIRISGGLAGLDGLCQKLSDLSGLLVQRPVQTEATARGIAWLAAGCPREWPPEPEGRAFKPKKNPELQERYQRFLEALEASK